MRKRSIARRLLALLLALTMCFTLLPMAALAEDDSGVEQDDIMVSQGETIIPPAGLPESDPAQDEEPSGDDGIATVAEGDVFKQVTNVNDITAGGQFVLVAEYESKYYALPTSNFAGRPSGVEVNVSSGVVTASEGNTLPVWTAEAQSVDAQTNGVSFNIETAYLGSGSSTSFTSKTSGSDSNAIWTVTAGDGNTFVFANPANKNRGIIFQGSNNGASTCVFGNYAASNVAAAGYNGYLLVFKNGNVTPPAEETKVETPTANLASGNTVVPGTAVTLSCKTKDVTYHTSTDGSEWTKLDGNTFTIPEDAAGTYTISVKATKGDLEESDVLALSYTILDTSDVSTIADARNGKTGDIFTVSGTVTFIDGRNVYVQDATAGIDVYCSDTPSGLSRGDTVTAYGNYKVFNGLVELDAAKIVSSTSGTLPEPKTITIADINESVESQLIKIVDAKVTDIISTNSVVTLSQGEGDVAATTTIYRCPTVEKLTVGDTVTVTAVVSRYNAFQLRVNSAADVLITDDVTPEPEPEQPDDPGTELYKPKNGDVVAIYYPKDGLVMNASIKGTAASAGGGVLFTDGSQLMLTASVDADGVYTFTSSDGKVLNTAASGGNLTLVEPGSAVCSAWKLEAVDNGWMIHSTEAAYNGNTNQYIEYYSGQFKAYSYKNGDDKGIYTMQFFPAASIKTIDWTVDTDVEQTIAQWGGGSHYEDSAKSVNGDLLEVGDMLDSSAVYTAIVSGSAVKPFTTSTSSQTGSTSWYMGGTGLGSGSDDYLQFTTSSRGWGGMTLSFRLRASNTGPGSFQLQYSLDGTSFADFDKGSYSYGYSIYESSVLVESGTRTGAITDGVAKTSMNPGNYVEFTFDVPVGAENAENLWIRMVPGTDNAKGSDAPGSGGVVRIDTVKLVGSPVVSNEITPYVTIDPESDEEVASGAEIKLTAASGATVHYGWANNETGAVTYTTGNTAIVPGTLPATLFVYASSAGKANSVTRKMTYLPASVASVRMDPNGGGVFTGSGEVKVTLSTATADAKIMYNLSTWAKDDEGKLKYEEYIPGTTEIVLNKGFGELTVSAYAEKDGFTTSAVTTRTFTERSQQTYQLFFGQMHSHTSYSDGAGTAAEAFNSVKNLDQAKWNMDFLSVTDHSNSFDDAGGNKRINDAPTGKEWNEGKQLARDITSDSFVGIFGYEMTWSNGLGHINTFNTTGYQDRTQTSYTTYSTALQNYYAELKTASASISQFNHPGTTFGDFSDFAHYDEEIDQLITLIEVGNGEGAIGSSGYFPSYEYYTRALDKGWHVAPTNNQDNHKGGWGTSNTGRDVVLVDELSEQAIYDAMRNYRVYATEDLNLEIYYQFDGNIMGSILDADSYGKDDKAEISVALKDPNNEKATTVQVIVNGGKVLAEQKNVTCNETVTFEIENPADYAYYYIKIVQGDGDIAVTAPVWVGAVEAVGISGMSTTKDLTVVGQEQGFTLELYNNEKKHLEVSSIVFTDKATGDVLHTAKDVTRVPKMGTASTSFTHTFTTDGSVTVTATVKGTLDGVEKTYTQDLELKVMPTEVVSKIVVDGTHYNDYVTGYYGGNMGNMTSIAATLGVDVVIKTDAITAADLEDCQLLVISAPARKSGTANAGDYVASTFEDSFIQTVKAYVAGGGSVAVCGLADYQDKGAVNGADGHAAAQLNKLLTELGSTMRINDDEAYDDVKNGGQAYRLYPEIFNTASRWCKGIVTYDSPNEYGSYQTYSQYSGCTVDPGSGTWLVKGFDTTYSIDSDGDGKGGVAKGNAYFLACEAIGNGNVFAAGGVFLSDFEVKAELDNIWDLPYANRTIFENILSAVREGITITDIADTRKAPLNKVFTIEGYVTSGTTNPNTTFFDSIYVQDETGGTDVFPYATTGLAIGTKVRVLGYTDEYQGDRELQVISLEILDEPKNVYAPTPLTTEQATDYGTYGGLLVTVEGEASDIVMAGGRVSQFKLTDSSGVPATVFIDGYITNPSGVNNIHTWLKDGQTVTAVGLLYSHPEGDSDESVPVLRVRNCDEITSDAMQSSSSSSSGSSGSRPAVETSSETDSDAVVTVTTAVISSKTDGTAASAAVSDAIAQEIVNQATRNDSDTVVISPDMGSSVTKAEVSIPASAMAEIAEKTGAEVRVEMPVADVTIPNEGLSGLAEAGGEVSVSAEISDGIVTVVIDSNGKQIDKVDGGITVSIPQADCTLSTVVMLVHDDGTTEVVRQSIAASDGQSIAAALDGSAKIVIVDNSVSFSDVSASNWAADAIAFASSHELMNGAGSGTFAPNASMTRGMLAMVLHNLERNPGAASGTGFVDVSDGAWYAEAVSWAEASGIITGYADGRFGPNDPVTREQLAVMLYRYAGSPAADVSTLSFVDAGNISSYAKAAIAWAAANGILNGKGGGILDPKGTATRAEVAQIMLNFVSNMF